MVKCINVPLIAIAVLGSVAIGCGDGAMQVSETLQARTFLTESVTVQNEPKSLVDGTKIRLSFPEKNRITVTAGCNILGGTVGIDRGHLVIIDLGSTEMGCDPA